MSFIREGPLNTKVGAETDEHHTLAALGNAVVGRVKHSMDDVVAQFFLTPAGGVMTLKAR